ncbi:hypothetical protein [Corynebacterium aquilae]|uniref:Uncharacterized protein n=1 Tax=Corynebacterium aquilae DSM 44791 TaxID=1431546 RepID=A0A1L7CEE0_9CORY|nr:hypothetical protein [Corynebacterium aquilae]APT84197.1 hypothetical protein CAQU_02925 [Corynebacterium aquilae DSM 44791]
MNTTTADRPTTTHHRGHPTPRWATAPGCHLLAVLIPPPPTTTPPPTTPTRRPVTPHTHATIAHLITTAIATAHGHHDFTTLMRAEYSPQVRIHCRQHPRSPQPLPIALRDLTAIHHTPTAEHPTTPTTRTTTSAPTALARQLAEEYAAQARKHRPQPPVEAWGTYLMGATPHLFAARLIHTSRGWQLSTLQLRPHA